MGMTQENAGPFFRVWYFSAPFSKNHAKVKLFGAAKIEF
jgi:hypothetical protein